MMRSIATGFVLAVIGFASPALADESRPAVAPPGRCAESRAAVDARGDSDFSVVGPVSSLFDPLDVAANQSEGDSRLAQAPQPVRPLARPGACDQPGSGCGAAFGTRPTVVVPPVEPGVRPPRGPNPGT